jgi:hypothetical protein
MRGVHNKDNGVKSCTLYLTYKLNNHVSMDLINPSNQLIQHKFNFNCTWVSRVDISTMVCIMISQ